MKTETKTKQSSFLKEWQPFEQLNRMVKRRLVSHFMKNIYQWQPTNNEQDKIPFKAYSFSGINEKLGLAYTSTGDYAGLWVCNAGYLWADPTHYFIGFAINQNNEVIGIAQDHEENEIFIHLV